MAPKKQNEAAQALGQLIRAHREALRITDPRFTLRQFAAQLDLSPTYLHQLEKGETTVRTETLKQIATLLKMDVDHTLMLAGKIDPELTPILKKPGMPAFLRTIDGLSEERLSKLQVYAEELIEEEGKQ